MKEEHTEPHNVDITVIGYADGIRNLEIEDPESGEVARVYLTPEGTAEVCEFLGEEIPDPDSEPPKRMG